MSPVDTGEARFSHRVVCSVAVAVEKDGVFGRFRSEQVRTRRTYRFPLGDPSQQMSAEPDTSGTIAEPVTSARAGQKRANCELSP